MESASGGGHLRLAKLVFRAAGYLCRSVEMSEPMRFPVIPLFLLALPFLEIAGFVIVGRQIGVLPTLGLVVASGMLGAILLRIQGFGVMTRIRKELDAGRDPSRELANGVMILLAGVLLLIPGFVTDIIGLLLFLPPVRELAWRFLKGRVVRFGRRLRRLHAPRRAPHEGPTWRQDDRSRRRRIQFRAQRRHRVRFSLAPDRQRLILEPCAYGFQFCALNGSSNTGLVIFPA